MSNITTFGEFMAEVVNRADKISFEKSGRPLSDKYEAPSTILKMIGAISNTGWTSFNALTKLLSNASYFAFAAALAVFVISPIGIIVVGALVYWGGKDSLKLLYNNRTLVEDVKTIGDRYENRFKQCTSDEEQNHLANQAAQELYNLK